MPFLSAFTPLGLLACSSSPSYAEQFYRAQVDAYGGQYRLEEGDHMEATIFARSIVLGATKRLLEHAGDQVNPQKAFECLERREDEYGAIPTPYQSLAERRRILSILRRLPKLNTTVNIATALTEILGDAFVAIRPTPTADAVQYPTNGGDQPMNFLPAATEPKNIRILDTISILGSQTVRYEAFDPDEPLDDDDLSRTRLLVGEKIVVDPAHNMQIERVEVTAVGTQAGYRTFTGTFTKAHDANTPATMAPFPYWISTKRHNLIILSDAGIVDAETRRKANEWCNRLLRGVSTWNLCGQSAAGVLGPFKVEEGKIGVTTIGEITLGIP
jgi:hypothetical protein